MAQAKWACGKILQVEQATFSSQNPSAKNIAMYAPNTGAAKKAWETDSSYDAWLVFNIWGVSNPDIGQIIPIEPELVIYRDAGVALTQHSLKNPEAKSFVTFLSSPQGHAIFKQFDWNK